jgi:hypothetical protein
MFDRVFAAASSASNLRVADAAIPAGDDLGG